jgi:hypothetical protein
LNAYLEVAQTPLAAEEAALDDLDDYAEGEDAGDSDVGDDE